MSEKSPLNESFSRAMAYYKALTGKNNKEIADALSLPATTVSAWNTGRHLPDMDRLQRLATYLDAPLDQFFDFLPIRTVSYKIPNEIHALLLEQVGAFHCQIKALFIGEATAGAQNQFSATLHLDRFIRLG